MDNKLKVLLLSDPFSAHTINWANGLSQKGIDITIFGLSDYDKSQYESGIRIINYKFPDFIKYRGDGNFSKVIYLFVLPKLKSILKENNPIILQAHSATSYGLIGALTNYKPFLISVWGSDVFNFPHKSLIHKRILTYNLSKADRIFSTSNIMASETKKYSNKNVEVIHFGVDVEKFKPSTDKFIFDKKDIVIGSIKALENKYGVLDLLEAFKILKYKLPSLPLKLLLVGRGSLENQIKEIINKYNLTGFVQVVGFIKPDEIIKYHNELDIMVAVSTEDSESFGVSVIEASSCGKPVIVSNKGGLKEVVEDNKTGLIVPSNNPKALADALEKLVTNIDLRKILGNAGRERVKKYFSKEESLNKMIRNYAEVWKEFYS
jgi:glycosyltransferase involved in cell wall biosynthesis